jgi:hypothetical protein
MPSGPDFLRRRHEGDPRDLLQLGDEAPALSQQGRRLFGRTTSAARLTPSWPTHRQPAKGKRNTRVAETASECGP